MGVAMCGVAFGNLLGPPLGGVLGYYVNLWFPFFLVGLILLLDTALQVVFVFLPHRREACRKRVSTENDTLKMSLLTDSAALWMPPANEEREPEREEIHVSPFTTMWALLHRIDILTVVAAAIVSNSSIGVIEPLVPRWLDDEFDQNIMWQGE
jgi:MFS family permease